MTMTQGMPPRAFAPVSGAPAAQPAPAPDPNGPTEFSPNGSIDLLKYGRDNNVPRPGPMFDQPYDPNHSVDLLAYGRDNGIPRPAEQSPLTRAMAPAPAVAATPPPAPRPPPQTERVNPLAGDVSSLAPGQSAPFSAPPALHVGGEGSYMRSFTNPQSAGMYDQYVRGLFGNKITPQRTGLTRAPAPLTYAGD